MLKTACWVGNVAPTAHVLLLGLFCKICLYSGCSTPRALGYPQDLCSTSLAVVRRSSREVVQHGLSVTEHLATLPVTLHYSKSFIGTFRPLASWRSATPEPFTGQVSSMLTPSASSFCCSLRLLKTHLFICGRGSHLPSGGRRCPQAPSKGRSIRLRVC